MLPSDLVAYAVNTSPAAYCQLFYVLAAATVLLIAATPDSIRSLLTDYGARESTTDAPNGRGDKQASNGPLVGIVGWVTSVGKVPHSWFSHFYVLSLCSSAFWMVQFFRHGSILGFIVRNQALNEGASMSINQVILAWFLMSLQGGRRLYEYVAIMRPSSSKMWIIHWLLGMAFYFCTNISIWIEGSSSIQSSDRTLHPEIPAFNVIIGAFTFFASWFLQYRCHHYLSRLQKYSLPENGLFRYIVCPHYTCECVLYASLALVTAPKDQLYNKTLACAVLLVVVNLGVTAQGTKKWYGEKFGREDVQKKWAMVPGIF